MESRVHRLERLLCYVLLAFVGFVDLIHGSLSRDDSRGTSRSSSNTTTTNGSNSNSTGSSGNSSGEGRGSDNSSNNNDNNRNNNNNNNNNNNGNQPSNNGEDAFRPVFAGQYLLPHHPHPPKHLQPVTPLHHQQQQQQQQQHQYKNLVTSGLFLHLDFNNDERKVVLPINITSLPRPTRNPANFTSDDRGQTFRDVTSDYNDANGTVLRVATKKVANAAARLLWLPDDKSHLEQKRRQHVVISRHRRQAPLYEKTDKTNKKVYFNNTRDPYEILNATRIKINVKDHNTKKSNKRDPNYFLYNTTKQLEKRMKKRPEMLLSDQAVTVRNVDSALLTKRERYGDFNPPLQIAFLKKPPSYDVSETGHTLTYECEVDTSNLTVDPEIYWTIPDRITKEKKGPEDLYPGEFRHDVYVDDNHTLIIKNVQMEHRGMYICVASVGQVTEMVTMVLRVMRVSGYDLFVRLIVGFSVAFVVIVGFGSVWMVLRVLNNRKRRAEEENGPTETTEIRRPTPDVHYFL